MQLSKRTLERLGIQTSSCLSKFDRYVFCITNFKANFLSFLVIIWLVFLSRNYWSSIYHDLMSSIWEKVIWILAGNLNSGRSYLITAVKSGVEMSCNLFSNGVFVIVRIFPDLSVILTSKVARLSLNFVSKMWGKSGNDKWSI